MILLGQQGRPGIIDAATYKMLRRMHQHGPSFWAVLVLLFLQVLEQVAEPVDNRLNLWRTHDRVVIAGDRVVGYFVS